MKECRKCGIKLVPKNLYPSNIQSKCYICNSCSKKKTILWGQRHKEKVKLWNKNKRIRYGKILHGLKINGCAICGYDECITALDFHHTNPIDKKFCISWNHVGKKDIVEELNKCILLCANCHREIEEKERGKIK